MTDDTHSGATDSTGSETRELTVSREIAAPPERVYEAFVDPDELSEWMHPSGFEADVQDFEAEEGGSYRISMRGATEETAEHEHSYTGRSRNWSPTSASSRRSHRRGRWTAR